jgi:hypothetical protein
MADSTLDPAQRNEIAADYLAGVPLKIILIDRKCCERTLYRVLNRLQVGRRRTTLTADDIASVQASPLGSRALAKRFRVGRETIRAIRAAKGKTR